MRRAAWLVGTVCGVSVWLALVRPDLPASQPSHPATLAEPPRLVTKFESPSRLKTKALSEPSSKPFDPFSGGDVVPEATNLPPLSGQIVPAEWPIAPAPLGAPLPIDPPRIPESTKKPSRVKTPPPPVALEVTAPSPKQPDMAALRDLVREISAEWFDEKALTLELPMTAVESFLAKAERLGWRADVPAEWTDASDRLETSRSQVQSLQALRAALLESYRSDEKVVQDVDRDIAEAEGKHQEAEAAFASGRVRIKLR